MPQMKCPRCEGKGVIEIDRLTLASLLEPVITEDMIGFRWKANAIKEIKGSADLPQLAALEKTEWFGDVAEKLHGVE